MTINTTIELLIRANNMNHERMAKLLGLKRNTNVYARLRSPGMTMRCAYEMLDVLGYEIVVREKHTGKKRDDEIIITMEDEVEI